MAGLDLYGIHVALAEQVRQSIEGRGVNVYAWPQRSPANPSITVYPGVEYVAYIGTFGEAGLADVILELVVEFASIDDESEFRLLADLLSAGTGHPYSIFDAVHSDKTLGGVVADAVVLQADWAADPESPIQFRCPVQIIVNKSGATL
jgi:hypothetical protein